MTPFPPDGGVSGATNTPDQGPSATEGVQPVRDALSASSDWERVEALAALLEPEAFNPDQPADEGWRTRTRNTALGYAGLVIASGYRRVAEDDDTIDRVAAAIANSDHASWEDILSGIRQGSKWAPRAAEEYRSLARAVVRALREETQDAELCQGCGNPSNQGRHGMSEFGGCV
jgi:hypothetical protein